MVITLSELLAQPIFHAIVVAAAAYGAIRTDLKNLHNRTDENSKSIDHAHTRIDKFLLNQMRHPHHPSD